VRPVPEHILFSPLIALLQLRECQGFILAYSITSRASFERVEAFLKAIQQVKSKKSFSYVVVANKSDQPRGSEMVSEEEGLALGRRLGCTVLEVSGTTGTNVDDILVKLIRALREMQKTEDTEGGGSSEGVTALRKSSKCTIL